MALIGYANSQAIRLVGTADADELRAVLLIAVDNGVGHRLGQTNEQTVVFLLIEPVATRELVNEYGYLIDAVGIGR